jgi:hypothetical protein
MRVLVDSSVLLDVMIRDARWAGWSEEKLAWQWRCATGPTGGMPTQPC